MAAILLSGHTKTTAQTRSALEGGMWIQGGRGIESGHVRNSSLILMMMMMMKIMKMMMMMMMMIMIVIETYQAPHLVMSPKRFTMATYNVQ